MRAEARGFLGCWTFPFSGCHPCPVCFQSLAPRRERFGAARGLFPQSLGVSAASASAPETSPTTEGPLGWRGPLALSLLLGAPSQLPGRSALGLRGVGRGPEGEGEPSPGVPPVAPLDPLVILPSGGSGMGTLAPLLQSAHLFFNDVQCRSCRRFFFFF